jgi:hypothetical protein
MFAWAVMQALYRFRLLDDLFDERLRMIPNKLILSSLAYRVAHEPTNGNPLLSMRRVVDVIEETGSNGDQEPGNIITKVSKRQLKDIAHWEGEVSVAEYEKYLFGAGIRVNSSAIVRQSLTKNTELISELNELRSDNLIYGRYDSLVAIYGGKQIMEYDDIWDTNH